MPKRTDIQSILVIGSGPIVIGQACEFDYSGTQACKALKEEGYHVSLINSNPATIMTDPDLVDATYIEPLSIEAVTAVIAQEKPQALLPTVGGQTALNLAMKLHEEGILQAYGVELIGASPEAIRKAEDRNLFRQAMHRLGLRTPKSAIVNSPQEARQFMEEHGLPLIIRPSFTLGGSGGGIIREADALEEALELALVTSPVKQALLEESVLGWKEYELEVMRDCMDNVVIVCSIENIDAMGVHTGDSITVAPAQTLSDVEMQNLRDYSIAIIREIGVATGGSNIQFAVNPKNGEVCVIEMNPRVSRSSALASKATGFPIARIAAKLAVGYTLDELPNEITQKTPACFEPSIDYVVTKIPRFNFEKFPGSSNTLTTQMHSVGEVMAIGRVFRESLQKALRAMETGLNGINDIALPEDAAQRQPFLENALRVPTPDRLRYVAQAMRCGWSNDTLHEMTAIDPWFLYQIREIVQTEKSIVESASAPLGYDQLRGWKRVGFSDARLAELRNETEQSVATQRHQLGLRPVYKKVDTCAAEFEAETPYFYSTYEDENEATVLKGKKALILGSGPNRIGQGVEFDYCCVHAALALKEAGWHAIMVNCNPETVSTDYNVSTRLYFEPVTIEDVMEIVHHEQPDGVIVQLGGQTPLKLAAELEARGVRILGTSYDSIDRSENRQRCVEMVEKLGIKQPAYHIASSLADAREAARVIGYPLMVRPSYVLGGRAMEVVHHEAALAGFFESAMAAAPGQPVLLDQFVESAQEVDVDVISDGTSALVAGMMEHVEWAGVHSGDSACCLPPHTLSKPVQDTIKAQALALALELKVVGLMNAQFAVKASEVYLIEVNPRASRTIPFVSKAIGTSLAKAATRIMLGEQLMLTEADLAPQQAYAVKETILPFARFSGADLFLGPEMRSTGEVMGRGRSFGEAFLKGQIAASNGLRKDGWAFFGVANIDKPAIIDVAKQLQQLGYQLLATPGTLNVMLEAGLTDVTETWLDATKPGCIFEYIVNNDLALVVNTSRNTRRPLKENHLRRLVLTYGIPYYTTIQSAKALVRAVAEAKDDLQYTAI